MLTLGSSLTNHNAAAMLKEGLSRLAQGELLVDCSTLGQVDSAAVAVLLAWQREAAAKQHHVAFLRPTAQLVSLATVYGVAELLAFDPVAGDEISPH